ncbi:MAG: hypothetical protein AAF961_09050 [Planctomycetota bacterium]
MRIGCSKPTALLTLLVVSGIHGCATRLPSPDSCAAWIDTSPVILCDAMLGRFSNERRRLEDESNAGRVGEILIAETSDSDLFDALDPDVALALYRSDAANNESEELTSNEEIPSPPAIRPNHVGLNDADSLNLPAAMPLDDGGGAVAPQNGTGSADACECGAVCAEACRCKLGWPLIACPLLRPPPAGPPPIRYRPELPPKFLLVPTRPVRTPVRLDAPDFQRGAVEVGFLPELRVQSRD